MCDCEAKSGLGKYLAKIGSQAGDRVHDYGQKAVGTLAKRFKDWTGLGDYVIKYNSLINPAHEVETKFNSQGRGLIVRHKEYIGDIITHPTVVGGFNVTRLSINPANVVSFPWMSPVAQQYDQYRPLGIIYEFVSTASETSTTASLGSVLMSTQYDVTDPDPVSKSAMMNRAYSSEGKMSVDQVHGIECHPDELFHGLLYNIPISSSLSTNDPRDFNMANFYYGTQGGTLPAGTIVGSLYVHYEFEFFKQVPFGGLPNRGQLWTIYNATAANASQACNFNTLGFGFGLTPTYGRNLGITFNAYTITIPVQLMGALLRFEFLWGSTAATVSAGTLAVTNCTINQGNGAWALTNYWQTNPLSSTSVTNSSSQLLISVNNNISSPATIVFSGACATFPSTLPASNTSYFFITIEVVSQGYLTLQ